MLEQQTVSDWERITRALIAKATDHCRPEDGTPDPEAFAQLVHCAEWLISELPRACDVLRTTGGYSWADIGAALGVSRSAAQKRFGVPHDSLAT